MANYATLKAAIQAVIKQNGNNEITGNLLQAQLLSIINSLGAGYQFGGMLNPNINPGTPDHKVFYITEVRGLYPNTGNIYVDAGTVLYWDNSWHAIRIPSDAQTQLIWYNGVGEHSSLADSISTFLVTGQTICVHVVRGVDAAPSRCVLYFRENLTIRNFQSLHTDREQYIYYTADNNVDNFGLYIYGGTPSSYAIDWWIVEDMKSSVHIVPDATRKPNIDTVNKVLNLGNCILCVGGSQFEMGAIWPSNPEKYTQISLKNGQATSATKIVFNLSTKELYAVAYSYRTGPQEVIIGCVRTVYGVDGAFVDADFPFDYTVDGVDRWKQMYPIIIPNATQKPNIDTVAKTLNLGNCIIIYNGKQYEMAGLWPNNPEKYTQIPFWVSGTSATKIVFNTATGEITARHWQYVLSSNEVLLGGVRINANNQNFIDANFIFDYTIDGKSLWEQDSDKFYYYGETIPSHSFKRITKANLSNSSYHQSMAIYGDIGVFFNYGVDADGNADASGVVASVHNLSTGALLACLNVPYGSLTVPHCNTAVFGNETYSENSIAPLLYLSQWNGERNCLVYDIREVNGTYSIHLIQTISTSGIPAAIEGAGMRDWVVDGDNNKIYSVAYKINSDVTENGNGTMIMCFDLPSASNANVVLGQNDITDNFELEFIRFFQDKCFKIGRLCISAGMQGWQSDTKIVAIDPTRKEIVTRIPLGAYWDAEPEGFDFYDSVMVYTLGGSVIYGIS